MYKRQGEEASFIAVVSKDKIVSLATSQDHKAVGDGDVGLNTGGMGAYSPAPIVDERMHQKILNEVMKPTMDGLIAEGSPYLGFLYAGIMINKGELKVLEFNCRFGDPETQPILLRLKSSLVQLCLAAARHNSTRLDSSLSKIGCVSGSPNRQLNSRTFNSPLLIIIPA